MRVRWLRKARLNLDSIYAYIAQDNPQAASRVIQQIVERVDDLAANPNLDTSRPGRVAGTRELVIPWHYLNRCICIFAQSLHERYRVIR